MIKGIKISTKITLLILFLSVIAVTAISFFTHDYVVKLSEEKFTTNLNVIADNRAAYFNNLLDRAVTSIRLLQESETLKSGGVSTTPPTVSEPDPAELMSAEPTEGSEEERRNFTNHCLNRQSAERLPRSTKNDIRFGGYHNNFNHRKYHSLHYWQNRQFSRP
jgi:hypothetical protein